ncbi:integral membrane protein DUF92-domain-containing protein [Gorgonomyces haynaldii]|nr:integral membrane protein DUF92-domain-containing protein [Gorgonomyces haynaldii]
MIPFLLSSFLAVDGYRKGSLDLSGSICGFVLGMVVFSKPVIYGIVLAVFYLTSSKLTKMGKDRKRKVEKDYDKNSRRTWINVMANGFTGMIWALLYSRYPSLSLGGYCGHFACCMGDTWSSEIGVLSKSDPFLITSLKRVPPGTNGGLSVLGLLASLGAGLLMGLSTLLVHLWIPHERPWLLFLICVLSAFVGSLLDSLLGATLQISRLEDNSISDKGEYISGRDILDNHQVNFASSLVISLFASLSYTQ